MGNIEISVIIPVYNVEPYLEICLNSVINQTFKDIEIICINDGSTDNSGAICDAYAKRDNRIRVVHQDNYGLSMARNVGLYIAKGRYISFIDSDDYVDVRYLEILYRLCEENNCQMSQCGTNVVDGLVYNDMEDRIVCEIVTGEVLLFAPVDYVCTAWNKLYDRNLFRDIKFPEGKLSEDEFIIYKVLCKVDRVAYTNSMLYYYLQRSDSITGSVSYFMNLDRIEAWNERILFFKEKEEQYSLLYKNSIETFKSIIETYITVTEENFSYSKENIEVLYKKLNYISELYREENLAKDKLIDNLIEENKVLKENIIILSNDKSFQIGKALTYIPRKIYGMIKCYKENGVIYTIKRCVEKVLASFK